MAYFQNIFMLLAFTLVFFFNVASCQQADGELALVKGRVCLFVLEIFLSQASLYIADRTGSRLRKKSIFLILNILRYFSKMF